MKKISYKKLLNQKNRKPIVCLTAYTKSIAKILDGKLDLVLVGDSLGTVLYGMKNTQSVTIQMMKDHGKAVVQNIKKSLTAIDMPYNSYKNKKQALKNAKEILNYTKADFIKLETSYKDIETISYLNQNKINIICHIGVRPQIFKDFKKIKSVGKTNFESKSLISLGKKLQNAGAKFILLECVKAQTAKEITNSLKIPTIGIGSSKHCDGQILVINDLLDLDPTINKPKFVKKYSNLEKVISKSIKLFANDVLQGKFPLKKHTYI